jgi:hypothetical protein
MGKLLFSQWVVTTMATLIGLGSFSAGQTSFAASNPWSRAIGEAKELQDETEDLRNRLNRLYAGSPAAQLSCSLDNSASAIVEMVKLGADYYQLQIGLQTFKSIQMQLYHVVATDCRIHHDQTTTRYLQKVEDRYNYLVNDLAKCRLPTSCPTHGIQSYSNPWALPSPYPSAQPAIPPGYSMPPVIPFGGTPYQEVPNQSTPNEVPRYWQGSLPPNSHYPRSTYDFEPNGAYSREMNPNYPTAISSYKSIPIDRPTQVERAPIAAEVLSLIIQRAASR